MRRGIFLISGGSRGIGAAIADEACSRGESVYLIAREPAGLSRRARTLQSKYGPSAVGGYAQVDLAQPSSVDEFCRTFDAEVAVLVNNAGFWREDRLDDGGTEVLRQLMEVNVFGLARITKGLFGRMTCGGRIINISSQLGTSGRSQMGAYSATKHAVIGLTRCWATEAATRQITVNAVCPGWVDTRSNREELAPLAVARGSSLDATMADIAKGSPLGRFILEAEVASLVVFLASEAASGITGQVYEIK